MAMIAVANDAIGFGRRTVRDMRTEHVGGIELRRNDRPCGIACWLRLVVALLARQVVVDALEAVVVLMAIATIYIRRTR
jgi:hypothetical protein